MTTGSPGERRAPAGPQTGAAEPPAADPIGLLKGFVSLRRLTGMYPAGHPAIVQKVAETHDSVQRHLSGKPALQLDIIHGQAHLEGICFRNEGGGHSEILRELTALGIDSIHIRAGISPEELRAFSQLLWRLREAPSGEPVDAQLANHDIHHISVGRLVPLDTRWRANQWPDAPGAPLDPAYEESVALTQRTFEDVAAGRGINRGVVREIVQLLIAKVAGSSAALGQILAVKLYENLTYYHSVNVATLSLLIAKQLGFEDASTRTVVEAALLHDIGKTRIPLDVIRKPGALDKRERKLMESHTLYGAEILAGIEDLGPLTPTVALEHHRGVRGDGYPDLGAGVKPHLLSQLVSVADIYEAMTGARSYQEPARPEQACLVLARLAGSKLNTALVKAFVNAISFFPVGSLVRTDRAELGVVIRTVSGEPLHPVIAPVADDYARLQGEIDTSVRDQTGAYARHVVETLQPPDAFDLNTFFAAA